MDVFQELKKAFPRSQIIGCSGGGVFCNDEIYDDALIATVISFERTGFSAKSVFNRNSLSPDRVGAMLAKDLKRESLASVLILGDGLQTNGERLLHGIQQEHLGDDVVLWGGMAGDGSAFQQNWLFHNGKITKHGVIAVGFYGDNVEIRSRAGGGWKNLGPKRRVTAASGSRVFALDNRSIVDIYSEYLGDYAVELPAIGARYPLMVERFTEGGTDCLRSVLAVDKKTNSMRFAGDIPEDATVQMMRGDLQSLLAGASEGAEAVSNGYTSVDEGIVIACNCIGRRMVLGQQAGLELEAIREHLPEAMPMVGFYSMGEIAQVEQTQCSDFFNETITLTTLLERNGTPD